MEVAHKEDLDDAQHPFPAARAIRRGKAARTRLIEPLCRDPALPSSKWREERSKRCAIERGRRERETMAWRNRGWMEARTDATPGRPSTEIHAKADRLTCLGMHKRNREDPSAPGATGRCRPLGLRLFDLGAIPVRAPQRDGPCGRTGTQGAELDPVISGSRDIKTYIKRREEVERDHDQSVHCASHATAHGVRHSALFRCCLRRTPAWANRKQPGECAVRGGAKLDRAHRQGRLMHE